MDEKVCPIFADNLLVFGTAGFVHLPSISDIYPDRQRRIYALHEILGTLPPARLPTLCDGWARISGIVSVWRGDLES